MPSLNDSREGVRKSPWLAVWRLRLPEIAIRWRFVALAIVVPVTVLAGYSASRVRFDSSVEVWFLDGDPQIALYHDFRDRFGKEQFIVVGLYPEEVVFCRVSRETPPVHGRSRETSAGRWSDVPGERGVAGVRGWSADGRFH